MGFRKKLLERLGFVHLHDYGLHLTPDRRVVATRGVVLDDGYGACVVGWPDGDLAAAELVPWGASRASPRAKALPAPPREPPRAMSITLPPDPPRAKSITAPPPIRAKPTTIPPVFAEATPIPARPAADPKPVLVAPTPPQIDEEVDWETEIATARARAEAAEAARALVEATGASAARARAEAAAHADAETEDDWEDVVARARAAAEAIEDAEPPPVSDDTHTDIGADDTNWDDTIARARIAAEAVESAAARRVAASIEPAKPKFMPASSATNLSASSSSTKLPAAAATVALPARAALAPAAFTKALPNGTPPPDGDARPRTVIPVPALPTVDPRLVRPYIAPVTRSGRR